MDVCPDLSQDFFDISPEVEKIHFRVEQCAFGADNECAPQSISRIIVIDAELAGKFPRAVGAHRKFYFFQHLFIALPGEVDEFCVRADSDYLRIRFFEFLVLLCQSSEFCCSDEGEVRWIKEQDGPFLGCFLSGKGEFSKIPLSRLKCFELEIGNTLTNAETAAVAGHDHILLPLERNSRNVFLLLSV
jgi:hypothetical protein